MIDVRKSARALALALTLVFALSAFAVAAPAGNETAGAPAATAPATPAATPAPVKKKVDLATAINEAVAAGKVNPAAATGFLGIPGAPTVNPIMAFVWAVWVGWIFSTVGAFGGVMAAIGHISVFGLGAYAHSFGKEASLNKVVTDSIRMSNQWLVGFSALVSSIKWAQLGRIVLPLGIALGIGSLAGSILVPALTAGKVSFKAYQGWFGIFVLVLGLYLFYETTPGAKAKKKKAAEAAKAFEAASKNQTAESAKGSRVKIISISASRVVFTFCGVEFSFNPVLPVIGGFIIASVAAFLGVGGGFLLVPFLTSITELPMYLAAGTSSFAVLVGMVTSISTFMFNNTPVYWPLVGLELAGVLVGSWIGPMTAKYLPDAWLKRIFIVLAFYVGLDFVLQGFMNKSLLSLIGL